MQYFSDIYPLFFVICSENTKSVLVAASFIHLKRREHAKYTSDLATVNPRILLSGPAGNHRCLFFIFLLQCSLFVFSSTEFVLLFSSRVRDISRDGRKSSC